MPSTFASLPSEIIDAVCLHLEPSGLNALMQTAKRIAWIASPRLYDYAFDAITDRPYLFEVSARRWESEFIVDYIRSKPNSFFGASETSEVPPRNAVLHVAAWFFTPRLLDIILPKGVNVNVINRSGIRPLQTALMARPVRKENVLRLLESGADILIPNFGGRSIFWTLPVDMDDEEFLRKLVDAVIPAGRDIPSPQANGDTPLHCAAITGNSTLTRILIENGADVLAVNEFGHEPLLHAVSNQRAEVTEILLLEMKLRGYDINACLPPVARALAQGLSIPSAPAYSYIDGDTILHAAVRLQAIPVIRILVDHGADPFAVKNSDGNTP